MMEHLMGLHLFHSQLMLMSWFHLARLTEPVRVRVSGSLKQPSYMAACLGCSVVCSFIHSNMNTPNYACMLMTGDER